jgi:holin-like protein
MSDRRQTALSAPAHVLAPGDGEILGMAVLFALAAAGELAARSLGVPVGGPVVGLVVLVVWLARRESMSPPLERAADGLLRHMGLLFVPAGVGALVHGEVLAAHLPGLLTALAVGTLSGLVAAGLVFVAVSRALALRPLPEAEGVRGP